MTSALERTGTWVKNRWLTGIDENRMRWIRLGYEGMLSVLTLGRGVPRTINGRESIRVSAHHRYVDETYEPEVFALLTREIAPDDIVFDVGAYIGVYSIILSRYLGENGRVHAFEPAPESAKRLLEHLELNHASHKVNVWQCGVSSRCGHAQLLANSAHIQNSFSPDAFGKESRAVALEVPVVSIDAFCARESVYPTWVKVDTEGWELHVLEGAEHLISSGRRVRFIVEMHPYAWASAGYDAESFKRFCRTRRLEVEPLTGQSDPFEEYGQVLMTARE